MDNVTIKNSVLMPSLNEGWQLVRDAEQVSIDNQKLNERFEINAVTATIIDLCDGQRSVEAIIHTLEAQFPESKHAIEQDVEGVLNDLHESNVLAFSPLKPAEVF
ncbi:MAG: PqqD family protein, partial [Arenicellales bacterium]